MSKLKKMKKHIEKRQANNQARPKHTHSICEKFLTTPFHIEKKVAKQQTLNKRLLNSNVIDLIESTALHTILHIGELL